MIATSFTRPMLTARNVFSSSLHHLGGVGRRDRHQRVDDLAVHRLDRLEAARRRAADDLGRVLGVEFLVARIDALGREAEEEVFADLEPRLVQLGQEDLAREAGERRRLEDDQHVLVQLRLADPRPPIMMKPLSGSFVLLSGVGTQMTTTSASPSTSGSIEAVELARLDQGREHRRRGCRRCRTSPALTDFTLTRACRSRRWEAGLGHLDARAAARRSRCRSTATLASWVLIFSSRLISDTSFEHMG